MTSNTPNSRQPDGPWGERPPGAVPVSPESAGSPAAVAGPVRGETGPVTPAGGRVRVACSHKLGLYTYKLGAEWYLLGLNGFDPPFPNRMVVFPGYTSEYPCHSRSNSTENVDSLRATRLASFRPEILVATFPASVRSLWIPGVTPHTDLFREDTIFCFVERGHTGPCRQCC